MTKGRVSKFVHPQGSDFPSDIPSDYSSPYIHSQYTSLTPWVEAGPCHSCRASVHRRGNKFGDHARKEEEGHTLMLLAGRQKGWNETPLKAQFLVVASFKELTLVESELTQGTCHFFGKAPGMEATWFVCFNGCAWL